MLPGFVSGFSLRMMASCCVWLLKRLQAAWTFEVLYEGWVPRIKVTLRALGSSSVKLIKSEDTRGFLSLNNLCGDRMTSQPFSHHDACPPTFMCSAHLHRTPMILKKHDFLKGIKHGGFLDCHNCNRASDVFSTTHCSVSKISYKLFFNWLFPLRKHIRMQMNDIVKKNFESILILKVNYLKSLPFRLTPSIDQKHRCVMLR